MSPWGNLSQELVALSGLILAAGLLGWALLLVARHRRDPQMMTSQSFERGFDLLLEGRWEDAAGVLTAAVKTDPNRTLEYFELGKLFRRLGQPGRAARLFEQLKARPDLDRRMRSMAEYELALSYRALGWYGPAVALLERVLVVDSALPDARQELRRLHEDRGRWEQAAALEILRLKWGETQDRRTLAALLTQQGKVAWAADRLQESVAHLRAALALDHDCTEAVIYLGRVLLQQGKLSQAFRLWEGLAEARPEWLFLAFRDMQAAFRHLRNEAGWASFLHTFTERHPADPVGYLALAEWYASQGQTPEAIHWLRQVVEIDPVCREAHEGLLSLYRGQNVPGEVLESYERLAQHTSWPSGGRFRCHSCGHVAHEPYWRCPACLTWATPERLLPQPSVMPVAVGEIVSPHSHANVDTPAPLVVTRGAPVHSRSER
jgi:lipopolysaccharide biosynthesis regulator YciM